MLHGDTVKELLELDKNEREQINSGFDPLATIPEVYIDGSEDLPMRETVPEKEGARYVDKIEFPTEYHPEDLDGDEVKFYTVNEVVSVETGKGITDVKRSMVPSSEELYDELHEEFYADQPEE
jgi:hypothetical protein